ncbi:hypothetical protein V496_10643 [Pseudogymnoascus sp. VKM F-4515 (FW-2607)]|nr:hypothetical protein V496_10643 [Pseudogymnoascus sp. VKM F-4515 (FW-2607)]KFY90927.1 hypothetical protein V498_05770 [Pseudogymnoascus sp. VKM F-4517 (FW-2822)]
MSLTQATGTTTITGASYSVICTSPEQLTACASSAKGAAQRCYEKECACSELDAFVGCYYEYCPGYGVADGGGVVNSFTCAGTRPISGAASSRRAAANEAAAESTGGLGGGITESRVTAAPTPASTGSSGSTSAGNSDQSSTTSTNDASKLFASAGVLFGSFIGVLALL